MESIKFETGQNYLMSWIGDSDLKTEYLAVKRTAKTLSVMQTTSKEIKTCRISVWRGVEHIYPMGKYSMCPSLYADKAIKEEIKSTKPLMKVVYKKQYQYR